MDKIDSAYLKYCDVVEKVQKLDKSAWTEADTRIKIIDNILFDVLGWDKDQASYEEASGIGFSDYNLKIENSTKLVVEAKKDLVSFSLEKRSSGKAYKMNGPVFNSICSSAIKQAITYAAFKGSELACATNGKEWIVFKANRLGDGKEVLEGKAFIFNSLEAIKDNFQTFYDLLSITAVQKLSFRGMFQAEEGVPIRDLSFFQSATNPDSKKLLDRGAFSADFDAIMSAFFERLRGDQDAEMIQKCFVVSPESELAEEKLLRIASDISEKIQSINSGTGKQLVDLIETVRSTSKNRFILLIGNKGAGKSTFIDRFFQFKLPEKMQDYLKILRVDLSKNTGNEQAVINWLDNQLLEEAEKAVFQKQSNNWNEIIGKVFFSDYQRWSQTTLKTLYETDKDAFKIKFGEYIEDIRKNQTHEYVKKLISYLTKSNQKVPCLIFDNTDHFSIEFQETVFQYARSIYESEFCVILMPITDKTSWQLSKQGALQSFESESLFLPTPKPVQIIERRIAYINEVLDVSVAENQDQYFMRKGIRLELADIGAFASGLNRIFIETPNVSNWIGGLVNHDIRRLLELTRDTISSPHLELDDLLKAHVARSARAIPPYKIKNAIVKKRYNIYPVGEHSFVQNVYYPNEEHPTSPLINLRILQYLRDATNKKSDQYDFIHVENIYSYFSLIGVNQLLVRASVSNLLKNGLILNFDPTVKELDNACRLEIAPSGKIHLFWGVSDKDYINIMKDITPIRDKDVHRDIVNAYSDYRNSWKKAIERFVDYIILEDETYCQIPEHADFERQRNIKKSLLRLKRSL